jgi:hypothetical protein
MTLLLPADFSVLPGCSAVTVEVLAPPPKPSPDPGGQGADFGKAAPVGLVVLLLFFLAVTLLARSMNKHLRRVPQSFEPPSFEKDPDAGPRTE